jgi:pimeloyl-ACP methyl ester carboxylesterase
MSVDPTGFSHGVAQVGRGSSVRLHYLIGGAGPPLFLLHGFPQTWSEWRRVMPALARKNRVIAVDLRGAGHSDRPAEGFDKACMAEDLQVLSRQLGFDQVRVVGHDIGAMVAFAWAAFSRGAVSKLALLEVFIPGGSAWAAAMSTPLAWHVGFHGSGGVAEMLIAGRELRYIQEFIRRVTFNHDAFSREDLMELADLYSRANSLHSAMEWYRTIAHDSVTNMPIRHDKLLMPVLTVAGEHCLGPAMADMALEFAVDVHSHVIKNCGHWIPEERPTELLDVLGPFLED